MRTRYIAIIFVLFSAALFSVVSIYHDDSAIDSVLPNFGRSEVGVPDGIKSGDARGVGADLVEVFKLRNRDGFLEKLDDLVARGIRGTPENINELDRLFKASGNPEEKIRLARLYGSAYFSAEDSVLKEKITQAISDFLRLETDPAVGRALVLSHSRMFFDEKTQENLEYAYRRNFLSNDDYYGELAHILAGVIGSTRVKVIKELTANHNQYASEIIADYIGNSSGIKLSKEEVAYLRGYIADGEPKFSGSPTSIGMIDVIRYEQWLKAMAYLENADNSTSPGVVIYNKLTLANVDPRAAIAFLISPYGKTLMEDQKNRAYMDEIRQRAEKYIAQHPSDSSLHQAGIHIVQLFNGG